MLKKQLNRVFIIVLLIPVIAIGSYLLYNNYNMLYGHHEEMLISDNLRIRSIIFEVTTSITNIAEIIGENDDLMQLISKSYENEVEARNQMKQVTVLSEYFSRHTEIGRITLYTDNASLISTDHITVVDTDDPWYNHHVNRPGYYWQVTEEMNSMNVPLVELQLMYAINVPRSQWDAVLIISIDINYLKNRMDNNQLDVDITVNNDPVFFSTWGNTGNSLTFHDYSNKKFFKFSGISSLYNWRGLMEVSTIKPVKSDDSIYVFSSDHHALDRIRRIQLWTLLIVCLSILIPSWIIINFTRQLTNRVDTLRREMHRVTDGDYNIMETFKGNDELVDLFRDLKVMIRSIEERDNAIFDARIKEQELINHQQKMEMEILSSKINPHFLYNTLETIRMKAFSMDDMDVANAVKQLGKYMRYNLESTGEATTLTNELDYIQIYLEIQKLRFANRINHCIHLDSTLNPDNIMILPLMIQPIVENAFIHGHRETLENGTISIMVRDEDDVVSISVKDNGCGMDKNTLEGLLAKLTHIDHHATSSFGLYNIHQRLKLYYGDDYGLTIVSTLDEGTSITFNIPHRKEEQSC